MKQTIITIIVLGLVLPAVAVASRVATGSTRNAIVHEAELRALTGIPERCLYARVTTKDGGNWAEVSFNGNSGHSCARWAFNGVVILRRTRLTHGRWDYVTSGSAMIPCGRSSTFIGIPLAVQQDLHLPCAVTPPTGPPGAQHLTEFLSPDGKIWCLSEDDVVDDLDFSCAANPDTFPQLSANLTSQGNVETCLIPTLVKPPVGPPNSCFVNFNKRAPVLQVGQQNYINGVLCKSATDSITCTLTSGPGAGKGFFISSTAVSQVGPS
jgi:hypothetical protein